MNLQLKLVFLSVAFILAACISSSCPPEAVTYLEPPYPPVSDLTTVQPQTIEIKGQETLVDRIITGPVCNDTWRGTLYVSCDIQVPAWERDPFFWQDCDLEIEEGAVVYVEAHKNKEYTDGCSCHK